METPDEIMTRIIRDVHELTRQARQARRERDTYRRTLEKIASRRDARGRDETAQEAIEALVDEDT